MDINITKFFNNSQPMKYSASVAELGQTAAEQTWGAACDDSVEYMMLDNEEKREAFKKHIADFGSWSEAEVAAWSDAELNALFIQLIAGDMREADLAPNMDAEEWQEYEAAANEGHCAGNIFRGDDGGVYYQLSY